MSSNDRADNPVLSDHPGIGAARHWLTTQAGKLVENQNVIQVDSEATIEEACETLIRHSIQSVPLYDHRSQTYVGMFDLHDYASYLLSKRATLMGSNNTGGSDHEGLAAATGGTMRRESISPLARKALGDGARRGSVVAVSDMSTVNPFYSVLPETTVAQVAMVFAKGAHRVAVMENERAIRGILSQTRVVRYFFEHCAVQSSSGANNDSSNSSNASGGFISREEDQMLDKTLTELGLVTRDIVTVRPETPVLQALSLLEQWRVSSLAVVDEEKRLVGNLSVGDVKYLVKDRSLISASCRELVQAGRFLQGVYQGKDRAAVFSVRPQATLRYALSKLVATGAHRLWITEPGAGEVLTKARCGVVEQQSSTTSDSTNTGGPPAAGVRSCRRASVSSSSSQTVAIAPPHFGGAFDDTVCGVISLTDVMQLLAENAPKPEADPEYNYASMD
ncbi:cell separation during budding [Coemansia asiatica]|uniref:Cell separation during budding n=1 Tax=Coemansia asiatica TaxID=1052880 RepID=A0A9W7XQ50_9FUNG|nr:cell separation during budding [Coemansia asiatica]